MCTDRCHLKGCPRHRKTSYTSTPQRHQWVPLQSACVETDPVQHIAVNQPKHPVILFSHLSCKYGIDLCITTGDPYQKSFQLSFNNNVIRGQNSIILYLHPFDANNEEPHSMVYVIPYPPSASKHSCCTFFSKI
jgi:hypothetical protein